MNKSTSPMTSGGSTPDTPSPWKVFWIVSVAVFLVSLDTTMLYAVFSTLRAGFPEATAANMSWVLNAYTVVYAAMLIPAGGLADVHGRKRVFLLGMTIFIFASAACGLASNVTWLIAARVLQAIGAALLTPASLSIILGAFPQERRAVMVSIWGAVSGFAAAVGPSLGSFIAQNVGWQWAFYINVPIGVIAFWRGAQLLKESAVSTKSRKVDIVGMGLLIVAVGAIALAIVESESPNWTQVQLRTAAGIGCLALLIFIVWINKVRDPLIEPSLFANPTYRAVNAATLTFGIAFAMMFFAFFFYMTDVWHYSQAKAGLAIAPGPLMVMPFAVVTGRLAGKYGHRPFLVGGGLLYALSGLWFLLVPSAEGSYVTQWLPGLFLSGAGVGMVLPSLSGAAVSKLPAQHYAVGSAVNQATRQIGAVIGVALTVMLLGHGKVQQSDFVAIYWTHICLALLTAVLCLFVNTRPRTA